MFAVTRYRLPLVRPLRLAKGRVLDVREGVLLHDLQSGGWGDAAPLPGFSPETVEDVMQAVNAGAWTGSGLPSLEWALDCARRSPQLPTSAVRVNSLWFPAQESPEAFCQRLCGDMQPVVKVKVGPAPDFQALRALLQRVPGVKLRVDANRRWDLETALTCFREIPAANLAYLEEPLADPAEYEALWARAPVPVALDETLLTAEWRSYAKNKNVVALVLKPTLIGGQDRLDPYLKFAGTEAKQLVWSSCFESGVGLWHLARLAAERAGDVAHGLDTGGVFATDLVTPRPLPSSANGRLPGPGGCFAVDEEAVRG